MRTLLLFVITFLAVTSCQTKQTQQEPFKALLQHCDQVNIVFYNGGDTLNDQTKDTLGIKILTRSILGKKEQLNSNCPPTGELHYLVHGASVLNAQFALADSNNKTGCNYVTYQLNTDKYIHKLTDRAGRVLKEVYAASHKTHP